MNEAVGLPVGARSGKLTVCFSANRITRAPSPAPASPAAVHRVLPACPCRRRSAELGLVPGAGRGQAVRGSAGRAGGHQHRQCQPVHRHRRRRAHGHRGQPDVPGQRDHAPWRAVHGRRPDHLRQGIRALHRRGQHPLPGLRPAHGRGPRRGQPGDRHPCHPRPRLPVVVAARQRRRRQRDPGRRARHPARRDVLDLPAGSAPVGVARTPDRHRYRGRHGDRARRDPARRQGAGAVHAVVHVPHRRAPPHRPAVPVDLQLEPQRFRLAAADLPEPGAELRPDPQPAPDDLAWRAAGRAVPLPGRGRARHPGRHVDAGRQAARPRPQPAQLRGLPEPDPALAGPRRPQLDQRLALFRGLQQQPGRPVADHRLQRHRRVRPRPGLGRGRHRRPLAIGRFHPQRTRPAVQPPATRLRQLGTTPGRCAAGRHQRRGRALRARVLRRRLAHRPEAVDQPAARGRFLVPAPDRRLSLHRLLARSGSTGAREAAARRRAASPS